MVAWASLNHGKSATSRGANCDARGAKVDKNNPRFSDRHPVSFSWRKLSSVVDFSRFASL